MLSGGKPAAVIFSRKGSLRLFQVGTLRPCLSLPSPVSTTIRCEGVSTTSAWIDILSRPSSLAKYGISHGSLRISSLLASGRKKRVLTTVSSSTTFVTLTLPMVHCIPAFPRERLVEPKMLVSGCPRNGSSAPAARCRTANRGARDARTVDFSRKNCVFDRESPRIRRQGG